jgi:hypothetical protein
MEHLLQGLTEGAANCARRVHFHFREFTISGGLSEDTRSAVSMTDAMKDILTKASSTATVSSRRSYGMRARARF